jgi:hypothetical protein
MWAVLHYYPPHLDVAANIAPHSSSDGSMVVPFVSAFGALELPIYRNASCL